MVFYGLALLPLEEAMREADPGVLQPWYADDAAIQGPTRFNATLLCALIEKCPFCWYFL